MDHLFYFAAAAAAVDDFGSNATHVTSGRVKVEFPGASRVSWTVVSQPVEIGSVILRQGLKVNKFA